MTVKRTPRETVIVSRDGQPYSPPIGRSFDFTAAEVKEIEGLSPNAFEKEGQEDAPVNTLSNDTAVEDPPATDQTGAAKPKPAAKPAAGAADKTADDL